MFQVILSYMTNIEAGTRKVMCVMVKNLVFDCVCWVPYTCTCKVKKYTMSSNQSEQLILQLWTRKEQKLQWLHVCQAHYSESICLYQLTERWTISCSQTTVEDCNTTWTQWTWGDFSRCSFSKRIWAVSLWWLSFR